MAAASNWTENLESEELKTLFGVFNIDVPQDHSKLSFAKGFLKAAKLTEFVEEIRSLARRVVLFKTLKDGDKKPGTVYVYEIFVKSEGNQLLLEGKVDNASDFFSVENKDLVKVIQIESNLPTVFEAETKVFKRYGEYIKRDNIYLQHVDMKYLYVEIAKASAKKKIASFKQVIESIRESIPSHSIENIVRNAVDRALSKENITQLCNEAFIEESGNARSEPYYCRSGSTIKRLKKELVKKTLESVSQYLGSEISTEIHKHIESELRTKFDPSSFVFDFGLASLLIVETFSFGALALVAGLINPLAGLLVAFVGGLVTYLTAVNVNDPSWRRNVANEIYEKVSENKQKVIRELTSDIKNRCEITTDHLTRVIRQLEDHMRRIKLIDQEALISEWEKPEVKPEIVQENIRLTMQDIFKDEKVLEKHQSISGYMHGTKHDTQVVKVFLRYNDEHAKREIRENISEGIHPEIIVITERFEEIKKDMAPIINMENSSPAVDEKERKHLDKIINEQADCVYKNHSDVVGLRISNVRCVDKIFKQEPCIVIYCLDKLFIPSDESKLPESLGGYPCDIRENIIMFGAAPGSSIGIPYSHDRGSVGFLAKSNNPLQIPVTGFLTAAHVVFDDLNSIYKEKGVLCNYAQESHLIVEPAWIDSADFKLVGEVVESFFGNYKPYGDGYPAFGIDAAFIKTYSPKHEVEQDKQMQIVDENCLKYGSTIVIKRGKNTGDTEGVLQSGSATISARRNFQPDSCYQFYNCFEIRNISKDLPFFSFGDSGSAVFVKENGELKPLGIAFAFTPEGSTFVCRIHHIVEIFNLSIYQEEEKMETLDC